MVRVPWRYPSQIAAPDADGFVMEIEAFWSSMSAVPRRSRFRTWNGHCLSFRVVIPGRVGAHAGDLKFDHLVGVLSLLGSMGTMPISRPASTAER
jgi:hypothetical protein